MCTNASTIYVHWATITTRTKTRMTSTITAKTTITATTTTTTTKAAKDFDLTRGWSYASMPLNAMASCGAFVVATFLADIWLRNLRKAPNLYHTSIGPVYGMDVRKLCQYSTRDSISRAILRRNTDTTAPRCRKASSNLRIGWIKAERFPMRRESTFAM
jgi:hypothetical protein